MSGWGKFVLVVNAFMSLVSMMYCFIKVSLVLVVGVVFNISPQGVMLARGEVATWVTLSDPWVSGLHQAAQLCALGPQAWDTILKTALPGGIFSRTIKLMLERQKSSIYQHVMLFECAKITPYQQDMSH